MRTTVILLAALLLPACIETADALNLTKNVPEQQRGAPEPSLKMQTTLCCAEVPAVGWVAGVQHEGTDTLCVQPRIGQEACDKGTVQMDCGSQLWHLDAIGPLWECR